jgi:hypothetical protein
MLDAASNDHGPIDLYLGDGLAELREFDASSLARKAL